MPRIKWPTKDAQRVVKRPPSPDKSRIKKATIIDQHRSGSESTAPVPAPPANQPPEPKASFLVQPPNITRMEDYMRPFVVTATGIPAATLRKGATRYRATVAIYYNNSEIKILDPSRIVEHTRHWTRSSATYPGQEPTRRIHFIFDHVVVDHVGEFTMIVSIFRPGDDVKGPPFLETPCSTLVQVASYIRDFQAEPLSKCLQERGVGSFG